MTSTRPHQPWHPNKTKGNPIHSSFFFYYYFLQHNSTLEVQVMFKLNYDNKLTYSQMTSQAFISLFRRWNSTLTKITVIEWIFTNNFCFFCCYSMRMKCNAMQLNWMQWISAVLFEKSLASLLHHARIQFMLKKVI